MVYTDFIGVLAGLNNTYDGVYTISAGLRDPQHLGEIQAFNGSRSLHFWSSELANLVIGSDGSLAPPFLNKSALLPAFISDICRSLYGVFDSEVDAAGGLLRLWRFTGPDRLLANASENPDNAGYCTPAGNCLPAGLFNLTECKRLNGLHIPVVASLPHFLLAAPEIQASVRGLYPDDRAHRTYVDIEPLSGAVLQLYKRLQINLQLDAGPAYAAFAPNLRSQFYPMLWINESAVVDVDTASQLRDLLLTPQLVAKIAIGVAMGLGSLRRRNAKTTQADSSPTSGAVENVVNGVGVSVVGDGSVNCAVTEAGSEVQDSDAVVRDVGEGDRTGLLAQEEPSDKGRQCSVVLGMVSALLVPHVLSCDRQIVIKQLIDCRHVRLASIGAAWPSAGAEIFKCVDACFRVYSLRFAAPTPNSRLLVGDTAANQMDRSWSEAGSAAVPPRRRLRLELAAFDKVRLTAPDAHLGGVAGVGTVSAAAVFNSRLRPDFRRRRVLPVGEDGLVFCCRLSMVARRSAASAFRRDRSNRNQPSSRPSTEAITASSAQATISPSGAGWTSCSVGAAVVSLVVAASYVVAFSDSNDVTDSGVVSEVEPLVEVDGALRWRLGDKTGVDWQDNGFHGNSLIATAADLCDMDITSTVAWLSLIIQTADAATEAFHDSAGAAEVAIVEVVEVVVVVVVVLVVELLVVEVGAWLLLLVTASDEVVATVLALLLVELVRRTDNETVERRRADDGSARSSATTFKTKLVKIPGRRRQSSRSRQQSAARVQVEQRLSPGHADKDYTECQLTVNSRIRVRSNQRVQGGSRRSDRAVQADADARGVGEDRRVVVDVGQADGQAGRRRGKTLGRGRLLRPDLRKAIDMTGALSFLSPTVTSTRASATRVAGFWLAGRLSLSMRLTMLKLARGGVDGDEAGVVNLRA
uniref:Membrane-associated protein n=1 Tax=Macrostomum lignano TaxID=282301 RepID=A0A1I8FSV6_9PLAT